MANRPSILSEPMTGPSAATAVTNTSLLSHLASMIHVIVAPLVLSDLPVAVLDFPQYQNVGDSMIWLGVIAFLAAMGIRPRYTCSYSTYSRDLLGRRLGRGTILITGGGNFGDLYPQHQMLRETVVQDFPDNRIVQLPQTIRFQSRDALARAARVFNEHPDVTLLVRDAESLATTQEHFRAPSMLCPDMALALPPRSRPVQASRPIVWLARVDRETPPSLNLPVPAGVLRTDWPPEQGTVLRRINRRMFHSLRARPSLDTLLQPPLSLTYDPLARERVRRGSELLSSGRAVVTNRLHAHLLCLLLGIPHVLLDNTTRKVRGFYEAWTQRSPIVEWADHEDEAIARAMQLGAAENIRAAG